MNQLMKKTLLLLSLFINSFAYAFGETVRFQCFELAHSGDLENQTGLQATVFSNEKSELELAVADFRTHFPVFDAEAVVEVVRSSPEMPIHFKGRRYSLLIDAESPVIINDEFEYRSAEFQTVNNSFKMKCRTEK